ncbi:shikimate dehydrogenase [Luteolibacter pohnpeiensis]|uniref:Shikimate dehydrogenase (NADP(+)) n=1 Tax=Luteolibacter pohnpeiensis TaxID=454153 RepID=A0A934S8N7_9BACT|nr:shikimate dehydrogenase [Luteolibacter pohnpeiensis]MBK1883380.1 shikimate dehydrogenase [Luteolibacter pohnpeiensis]
MPEVYSLEDLVSRDTLDAGHSKPAKLAVIGNPIAHSASPYLQQPALDANDIDARYIRVLVEPGRVAEAFDRMRALDFIGCNVTVPHKFEALEACSEVHPDARSLGAVNTVRFDADAVRGFNTDGPGFVRAIADEFNTTLSTLKVMIVGAGGGAGQAIATQCAMQGVEKLVLVNRTVSKLGPLVNRMLALGSTQDITALSFEDEELSQQCRSCDLIVNTSSVGLKVGDPSILPPTLLRSRHLIYDTIYQPAVTPLLAAGSALECKTANGLSLLIHQGVLAFQHWFPQTDPISVMREAMAARIH